MITRSQATDKVNELISNNNLKKHCYAVEAAMGAYADYFKVSPDEKEQWMLAGLLHDADWEKYPDQHPQVVIKWLQEQGASDDFINAIAAHGFNFNIEAQTLMAKTLRAVDELTGLIVAIALVRESKKLADVTVESIVKKWKTTGFAKGVNRSDIERGAQEINMSLNEHINIVLTTMQAIASRLGL